MRKLRVRWAWIAALIAGCSGEAPKAPVAEEEPKRVEAPDVGRARVEQVLASGALDRALCERAVALAWQGALKQVGQELSSKKAAGGALRYGELLGRVYGEGRAGRFVASSGGLSARGALALEAMRGAEAHGMAVAGYGLEAIDGLLGGAASAGLSCEQGSGHVWSPVALSEAQRAALLGREVRGGDDASLARELAGALVEGEGAASVEGWVKVASATQLGAARLELRVADGFLQYAREMREGNIAGVGWKEIKAAGGSKRLVSGRLEALLRGVLMASDEDAGGMIKGLVPTHPQYKGLLGARALYKGVVAAGGWERVDGLGVGAGNKRLWRRLEAEGYVSGALEVGAMREGLRRYYQTHQIGAEGGGALKSLNVSAERRLEQVEQTMRRFREESLHEGEQTFVYINLPYFHGELWEEGELKHRFSVVIGKANKVCNEKTKRWERPNATPVIKSDLDYFMLNPVWYVPDRIVEEEIRPKAEKDESWLEANHYEVVSKKKDKWEVRQTPGPWNALGLVKFIFPNRHNTYLHDTSHREYFERTIRAYSHGCMRVEDPLKFAKLLAEVDGQEVDIDALIEAGRTKMVKMQKKIPVLVEYYTVHVDEAGSANFLLDIYDLEGTPSSEPPADCTKAHGYRPSKGSGGAARGDIGP